MHGDRSWNRGWIHGTRDGFSAIGIQAWLSFGVNPSALHPPSEALPLAPLFSEVAGTDGETRVLGRLVDDLADHLALVGLDEAAVAFLVDRVETHDGFCTAARMLSGFADRLTVVT